MSGDVFYLNLRQGPWPIGRRALDQANQFKKPDPISISMQRDVRLDVLRVAAVLAVIWLHVSGEVVVAEPGPEYADWWVGNIADAFSRWCVPLFVMASGALLLPQRPDLAPVEFYRRRAARILLPTIVWTVVYLALRAARNDLSASSLLVSVVRGTPYYHLWFLYMIAGLYLAAPLLSRFLACSSRGFILGAIALIFAVSSVESVMASVADEEHAYTFLGLWPHYLGYFLAGYYLWRWPPSFVGPLPAAMLALACGVAIALLTAALFQVFGGRAWQIAYANLQPLVVMMSLAIFVCVMRLPHVPDGGATKFVARAIPLALGVYVIHPIWLLALKELGLDAFFVSPIVGIPLTTALAFVLSLASARVLAAVPVLRRAI